MRVGLCFLLAYFIIAPSCASGDSEEILVSAAASLTDVMERLGQRYSETGGIEVNFNFGGSAALAQQIIRGAPVDVFVFAGPQPMEMLAERGLIATDTAVVLLTNQLVLVARPSEAENLGIASVFDLAGADIRVAIADPDLAPAGEYAREALRNLGLWEELEPRVVPSPDVRVALGYVETGSVDVGIVYRTDAQTSEDVRTIAPVPDDSYPMIGYPAGLVRRSTRGEAGRSFLAYLTSEEAQEIFLSYGFIPIALE